MAFIADFRRANYKSSWRRSTFRNAGLSKRKFRRCLNEFIDGINLALAQANRGYYGFPSKEAYEQHYRDPAAYAAEIPAMEAYAREADAEHRLLEGEAQ